MRVGVWLMRGDGRLIASTSTDAAGGFSFAHAPAGPVEIHVMRARLGRQGGALPRVPLDLEAGVAIEGVEIVVPAPPPE